MVNTDNKDLKAGPRVCVLSREPGMPYGFFLRQETFRQGHIITDLAPGGIAERSGLKDGDRLLEVNSCYVDDLSHEEIIMKINLSGNQVSFLVLSGGEYEDAKVKGKNLKNLSNRNESCKLPRLCHISKDPMSGLGISFTPVEGEQGHFVVSVSTGGSAEKAGVCRGDRLVWMNGVPAEDLSRAVINWMLRKCGSQITVLVLDAESEEYYNSQKMPILPAMATEHNLPFKSRRLHMVAGDDGFGFILRYEWLLSECAAHTLRDIDEGSPAARAGMVHGDRLLEVNGEAVGSMSHEEVVERVRKSERGLTLTCISPQGLDFYTRLGVSPLLFCEDVVVEDHDRSVPVEEESSLPTILIHEHKEGSIKSKLCSVQRRSVGYGFHLCTMADVSGSGIYVRQVVDGGPGQEAGLESGDEVLEINGQNVEEKTLEDVMGLMEEGGSTVSMQVIQKNEMPESAPEADSNEKEEETTYL